MGNCPICNSRAVGRVGTDQFYCWDCFVEYNHSGNQLHVFDIGEDGSLEELEMADTDASLL
ncbi:MAG: hypothetical protein ACOYVD_04495 [Bacillota bacterium]